VGRRLTDGAAALLTQPTGSIVLDKDFLDCGELLTFRLTPGNVDDHAPVPEFAKHLFGKLFGDKDYLSQPLLK
jgi:hypothetical protein